MVENKKIETPQKFYYYQRSTIENTLGFPEWPRKYTKEELDQVKLEEQLEKSGSKYPTSLHPNVSSIIAPKPQKTKDNDYVVYQPRGYGNTLGFPELPRKVSKEEYQRLKLDEEQQEERTRLAKEKKKQKKDKDDKDDGEGGNTEEDDDDWSREEMVMLLST